jgi:hypothetical protein
MIASSEANGSRQEVMNENGQCTIRNKAFV